MGIISIVNTHTNLNPPKNCNIFGALNRSQTGHFNVLNENLWRLAFKFSLRTFLEFKSRPNEKFPSTFLSTPLLGRRVVRPKGLSILKSVHIRSLHFRRFSKLFCSKQTQIVEFAIPAIWFWTVRLKRFDSNGLSLFERDRSPDPLAGDAIKHLALYLSEKSEILFGIV